MNARWSYNRTSFYAAVHFRRKGELSYLTSSPFRYASFVYAKNHAHRMLAEQTFMKRVVQKITVYTQHDRRDVWVKNKSGEHYAWEPAQYRCSCFSGQSGLRLPLKHDPTCWIALVEQARFIRERLKRPELINRSSCCSGVVGEWLSNYNQTRKTSMSSLDLNEITLFAQRAALTLAHQEATNMTVPVGLIDEYAEPDA